MAIITITSDWNQDDYYSAALKGKIISRCPDARVVNITSQIPPFNVSLAAFRLKHAYRHFPDDSIHLIAVNSEPGNDRPIVALRANGHYFIGNDNGMFGLLLDNEPDEIVAIDDKDPGTFPEITVFAETACSIALKGGLSGLGKKYNKLYRQVPMLPAIEESVINGSVIYIDSYKNAITNINRDLFQQIGKGRSFEILVQSNHYKIRHLNNRYNDSSPGEMVALFNSIDLLEIAINRGNAADLLNLAMNSSIRVKFR